MSIERFNPIPSRDKLKALGLDVAASVPDDAQAIGVPVASSGAVSSRLGLAVAEELTDLGIEPYERLETVTEGFAVEVDPAAPVLGEPGSAEECGINLDAYNALPEDLQAAVTYACESLYNPVWTEYLTNHARALKQLVELRGEMYEANHILLVPQISSAALQKARTELDSIRSYVVADTLSFAFAANKYSDDERTKNQNGTMVNMATGSTMFEMDELDPTLFLAIDTLELGGITRPFFFQNPASQQKGYRVVKLIRRTDPHRANPVDDYAYLQEAASQSIRGQEMDRWLRETIRDSYVRVDERYHTCKFRFPWLEEKATDAKAEIK